MIQQLVVFDTGAGGHFFATHLRQQFPDLKIIEIIDSLNAPYGSRPTSEIISLTEEALRPFLSTPSLILLACNTATLSALNPLRLKYPLPTFVGVEPGLKPASQLTQNGQIIVLATPSTLRSSRYRDLKQQFASNLTVLEPDCSLWASYIDSHALTPDLVATTLAPFTSFSPDVIVLGCTHYLSIPPQFFKNVFPKALIYSPLSAITSRIKQLLGQDSAKLD